jgi:hypothetical protein
MAYEIPQQLKYEEKILFGLTFKQMVYAMLFIFPALTIFLKTSLNIYMKIIIVAILASLGCLFMFFDFWSHVKDFSNWFMFREVWLMEPKMIEFLGIEKVEEGIIYVWKTKKPTSSKPLTREEKQRLSEKIGLN